MDLPDPIHFTKMIACGNYDVYACRHKVADFDNWKQVLIPCDCTAGIGATSGESCPKSGRPTEVILWFEVTDLGKARAFVNSPEVPDARQQSGVAGEPDIYFLS